MKQIRRNTFETNSSSTHSISICGDELIPNEIPIEQDYAMCNGKPTMMVYLNEFCCWNNHESQMEKLAYIILQIAYILNLPDADGFYGSKSEIEESREKLYASEEFKELEDIIGSYAGCKHIRIEEDSSGYIDHDSVCSDMQELKEWDLDGKGYLALVYGKYSCIHFEFNG